jgi:hypothetical protein
MLTLCEARYEPLAVLEVTFDTCGAVVSTTKALLLAREFAVAAPVATVVVALFPAASTIVPPLRASALADWQSRSEEFAPAAMMKENVSDDVPLPPV